MEIGNLKTGGTSATLREQKRKDVGKKACFKFHKPGCRPWKCNPRANNVSVNTEELTVGGSEDIYPELGKE